MLRTRDESNDDSDDEINRYGINFDADTTFCLIEEISDMSYSTPNSYSSNKYGEHQDRTSLGKLRSKYWTTKQLVIKKLGREQDEFIIASDADVDAKLELLYTIKRSCHELLRVGFLSDCSLIGRKALRACLDHGTLSNQCSSPLTRGD